MHPNTLYFFQFNWKRDINKIKDKTRSLFQGNQLWSNSEASRKKRKKDCNFWREKNTFELSKTQLSSSHPHVRLHKWITAFLTDSTRKAGLGFFFLNNEQVEKEPPQKNTQARNPETGNAARHRSSTSPKHRWRHEKTGWHTPHFCALQFLN